MDPAVCLGNPIFRSTRIPVADVLAQVGEGMDWGCLKLQCAIESDLSKPDSRNSSMVARGAQGWNLDRLAGYISGMAEKEGGQHTCSAHFYGFGKGVERCRML